MPQECPENKTNSYYSDPDVRLMLDFQQGNKRAFEKLMRLYFPRLLNFIYRFIPNRETAEDLTQEVFIKVYKSAAAYIPLSKFQTWIFTIAKNISLNEIRRNKNSGLSLDEAFGSEKNTLKDQIEDKTIPCPDRNIMQEEIASAVKAAINSLPENQRVAVLLCRYEKFSYKEIAETMNLSVEAVKSLLSRGKENLKGRLAGIIDNN